jgi:NADH:ubiquinone oxidoreductase subunit F (NADH-binding)
MAVATGACSPPTGLAAFPGSLPRLLPPAPAAGPVSLAGHLARYGPPPSPGLTRGQRSELLAEVARSGLTGRGGAGFPTARKMAAVAAGRGAVVVANGTEGEPATAKDKVLLARSPHLVLDGAALAAEIVGARRAVIVAHRSVREILAEAAAARVASRLDKVRFTVIAAADGFVAGEASAVVHWIGRGIPAPMATPPRPAERGLGGAPTLVQNVETLAHLALIGRYGASWFRSVGTAAEPGSMLVTVLGAVREPGVAEVAIGTPLGEVLDLAGGASGPLRALLIGGYFGTWAGAAAAAAAPFSAAGLADVGAGPGAGLIAALPSTACGLAETARVARYLAGESAGQCGPCRFGLDAIAGEVQSLADGRGADRGALARWLGQVDGRGACRHPDGMVRLVRSALREFADELDLHARGWCSGTAPVLPVPQPRSGDQGRAGA